MIYFKKPEIQDKLWYQKALEKTTFEGCDMSFVNTFIWSEQYDIRIAYKNGFVFKSYFRKDCPSGYVMPFGGEDIKWALNEILIDSEKRDIQKPIIGLLTEETKKIVDEYYPNRFNYIGMRNDADYIYKRDDLALLNGRQYHSKRNHISQFKRLFPYCEYKPLDNTKFDDVLSITKKWCQNKKHYDFENFFDDFSLVKTSLDYFDELELFGGVLYVTSEPIAMTIASKIRGNICDVHFEKSINEKAYAVICNEFAKQAEMFEYINREEDLGLEGLRKSKLSYNPIKILMKYAAVMN